jgi:3-dehydroquinate dehydratase
LFSPHAAAIRITENSTEAWRQQLRILDLAVQAGAQAIDLEIETVEAGAEKLNAFRGRTQIIISYHNFDSTPHWMAC